MQPHSYPEAYIRKGNKEFYQTSPWNDLWYSGSPEFNSYFFLISFNSYLREMNFDFLPNPNIPCELRTTNYLFIFYIYIFKTFNMMWLYSWQLIWQVN